MTRRDYKRRACRPAAILLEKWIVADHDKDGEEIVSLEMTEACRELIEELFIRCEKLIEDKQ
jgi:hypothetical protein